MGQRQHRPDADKLQELIGTFYEAAVTPSQWPSALESLARAFDATSADFHGWDPRTRDIHYMFTYNLDHLLPDYLEHYIHINPRTDFFESDPQRRRVFYDYLFTDERDINRNEFYNWIDNEGDARYGLGIRVEDSASHAASCGFHFSRSQGHPGPHIIEQIEMLAPHLTRAVQMTRKLEKEDLKTFALGEAIQSIRCGVILVDHNAQVLFTNRAAETILETGDGLTVDNRRELRATKAGETKALRSAISSVILTQSLLNPQSRPSLLISRACGAAPYEVMAAPAQRPSVFEAVNGVCALLLVSNPDAQGELSPELLKHYYKLTPAESRLCVALINGAGVTEAARELGITENTARSRLKQIFSKTGVKRQADLIALLNRHQQNWWLA